MQSPCLRSFSVITVRRRFAAEMIVGEKPKVTEFYNLNNNLPWKTGRRAAHADRSPFLQSPCGKTVAAIALPIVILLH